MDMILAETVEAYAARAVSELKLGVVCIRASANAAFMRVAAAFIFRTGAFGGFFHVNHVGRAATKKARTKKADSFDDNIAAEEKVIQNGDDREKRENEISGGQILDYAECEKRRVNISKPFYLYWDNEEEQNSVFRVKRSEDKEHGKIYIR